MNSVEYFVESLQLDIFDPVDPEVASVHLKLSVGEPDLENDRLRTTGTLDIVLTDPEREVEGESFSEVEPDIGEGSIEAVMQLNYNQVDFFSDISIEEEVDTWRDQGYQDIHPEVISELEADLVPEILVPIDQLIGNSVKGLIPRYRLTPISEEREEASEE